jgi:hypothetical protein
MPTDRKAGKRSAVASATRAGERFRLAEDFRQPPAYLSQVCRDRHQAFHIVSAT